MSARLTKIEVAWEEMLFLTTLNIIDQHQTTQIEHTET